MTKPIHPANNKDLGDHIGEFALTAAYEGTKTGWGISSAVATPLYQWGKWAWQKAGGSGSRVESYWNGCQPSTQETLKKVASRGAGVLTAAGAYVVGSTLGGVIPGAVAVGSGVAGVSTFLGTATTRWLRHKQPLMTALKEGGVAAVGAVGATYMCASGAVAGGVMAAAAAGSIAAGATSMAVNPGNHFSISVPMRGHLELRTPGDKQPVKEDQAATVNKNLALKKLSDKISEFRGSHPNGQFYEDPRDEIVRELESSTVLNTIRQSLKQQASHQSEREKVVTLTKALEAAGAMPENPTIVNISLYERLIEPQHAEEIVWSSGPEDLIDLNSDLALIQENVQKTLIEVVNKALRKAGPNPPIAKKVEVAHQTLQAVGAMPADASLVDVFCVEKIEAIPTDTEIYINCKKETDKQIDLLVQNSSVLGAVYFIHINRLGKVNTDAVYESMKKITKEVTTKSADGKYPDLLTVYMKHLGSELSFFERLKARFFCWLVHDLGVFWNGMNEFVKNVIIEFRKTVEPKNQKKLNSIFEESLRQMSNLLDRYNGAAIKCVADPQGNLSKYQKDAIDSIGDKVLYDQAIASGEDIGKKMMELLCKSFSDTLIKRCLPDIKIWASAKKIPYIGCIIAFFANFIEMRINSLIRKKATENLPYGLQMLVETGLDQTLPDQYAFKTAIAECLIEQLKALKEDMKIPYTGKPARLSQSPETDKIIEGTVDRLIKALKMKRAGINPTKEQIQAQLDEIERSSDLTTDKLLSVALMKGAQIFMYYYSRTPEKMEYLFGNLLALTNNIFDLGAAKNSEEDYQAAVHRLEIASKELISDVVQGEVKWEIKGPDQTRVDQNIAGRKDAEGNIIEAGIYDVQRDKGIKSFELLSHIGQGMLQKLNENDSEEENNLLKDLHYYAETLKDFSLHAKSMNIDLYPLPVQQGFYETFYEIYQKAIPLSQEAIELQKPQIEYDKFNKIAKELAEVETMLKTGKYSPVLLQKKINAIQELGHVHNTSQVPQLKEKLDQLREHLIGMQIATEEAEKERVKIEKLQTLGNPSQVGALFLANPKAWTVKLRNVIDPEDQVQLFARFRSLAAEAKQPPSKMQAKQIATIQKEIDLNLQAILVKRINSKNLHTALNNLSVKNFQNEVMQLKDRTVEARETVTVQIRQKLESLVENTDAILAKFKAAQMPKVTIPMANLAENGVQDIYSLVGAPKVKRFEPYLDQVFNFMTDHDIYQGCARLVMDSVIKKHKKA